MSTPPRTKDIFFVTEGGRYFLNLSELLIESRIALTSEYPFVAEILTPTQTNFSSRLGWGEFVRARGCTVMSNAFPQPTGQRSRSSTSFHSDEDTDWDAGMEHDVVSLLEENARLRALVVRLSDLVLKSVVEQK
jgi:hypothetical protein